MALDLSQEIIQATTPSDVVSFDQNTPTTGGVVFTPDTPATTDVLYVSSTNASTWIYNGSAYVTYTAPTQTSTTPFYLKGTTIDAQGNKTANIERNGSLTMSGGFYGPGVGLTGVVFSPRVQSVTSSATVTPTSANELVKITAQAASLSLANPTGTFVEGQALIVRIKDNGTARSISFDTKYRAIGVTLPTTTTISKTTYLGIIYNSTDDKFDVIAVVTQA